MFHANKEITSYNDFPDLPWDLNMLIIFDFFDNITLCYLNFLPMFHGMKSSLLYSSKKICVLS